MDLWAREPVCFAFAGFAGTKDAHFMEAAFAIVCTAFAAVLDDVKPAIADSSKGVWATTKETKWVMSGEAFTSLWMSNLY